MIEAEPKPAEQSARADHLPSVQIAMGFAQWFKMVWPIFGLFVMGAAAWFDLRNMVLSDHDTIGELKSMAIRAQEQREEMIAGDAVRRTQLESLEKGQDQLLKRMDGIYEVRTRLEAKKGL